MRASLARIDDQSRKQMPETKCRKQNVPPFRGGTWEPFYAHGDNCQPVALAAGP
jgi:hypothetical protein